VLPTPTHISSLAQSSHLREFIEKSELALSLRLIMTCRGTVPVFDYAPAPAHHSMLTMISELCDAHTQEVNRKGGILKRNYFLTRFPEEVHIDPKGPKSKVLKPSSLLYAHRGNEFVFKHSQWASICYPTGTSDLNAHHKGVQKLPNEYYQILFPDLQGRERTTETSWMLAAIPSELYDLGKGEKVDGVEYDGMVDEAMEGVGGHYKLSKVEQTDESHMDVD